MIKIISNSAVFIVASTLLFISAFAQGKGQPLVPLASIADHTHGDGWARAVGLKMESLSVYDGAEEYVLEIKPDVAIQWRSGENILFLEWADIDGLELGWRGLIQNNWFMQVGARHETVLPTGDTQAANINGFPHRGSHVIGFFESRHSLTGDWRNWVLARLSAGPASFGYRGLMALGHRFGERINGTGVDVSIYSSIADKKNLNNYFGVTESDALASGLESSDLSGGYRSTGLNVIYRKNLVRTMQVSAQAGVEIYSDNIKQSSIVSDSPETKASISILWRH